MHSYDLQAGDITKNAVSNGTNFDPVHGADGWQISNLPILSLAIWPQSKCLMKWNGFFDSKKEML
jgi:hypothetical protein